MPTAIWKSRLRSGSAHCDLEVAVEVRQCPLGSGARGGGPAVPTGIWTARRRRRVRRRRRRRWRRRRRRRWRMRRRTALIKSNNPHLAGGEILEKRLSHQNSHLNWYTGTLQQPLRLSEWQGAAGFLNSIGNDQHSS